MFENYGSYQGVLKCIVPREVTVNASKGKRICTKGVKVDGVVRRDVSQFQLTGTKLFGPISGIGAEGGVFIAEIATTQIHSMPDPKILPLEGSGSGTEQPIRGATD